MQENQNTQYANRIKEIDERIEGLKSHMSMWGRAGAGKMAMKALDEIESLTNEKNRILNGTQEKYEDLQSKIEELKKLKAQCLFINFIKKNKLEKEIISYEEQKNKIK